MRSTSGRNAPSNLGEPFALEQKAEKSPSADSAGRARREVLESPSRQAPGRSSVARPLAQQLVHLSRLLDAVIVAVFFALVWKPEFRESSLELVPALLLVPFWMWLLRYFGLYESHRVDGVNSLARRLASAQVVGGLSLATVTFSLFGWQGLIATSKFLAATTFTILLQKAILRVVLRTLRRRGVDQRNVCVIGQWETAAVIAEECGAHPEWGLHVVCVGVGPATDRRYLSHPEGAFVSTDFEEVLRKRVIDELLIAVSSEDLPGERAIMGLSVQYGLLARALPLFSVPEIEDAEVSDFNGRITIGVSGLRQDRLALTFKRVLDVALASTLLVLSSPLMVAAALLVKLSSPGPLLFVQTRVGLRGRKFSMFKLRTMIDGAETLGRTMKPPNMTMGPTFKNTSDWRITPIGRILRHFSIDELPQLLNVVRGEMSLVGPRPLPAHEAEAISGPYRKRFSVRPGITCLWQVKGRSDVEYSKWMTYDLQYVDTWSLWLDAKLLLQTIPAVLSGRGAY